MIRVTTRSVRTVVLTFDLVIWTTNSQMKGGESVFGVESRAWSRKTDWAGEAVADVTQIASANQTKQVIFGRNRAAEDFAPAAESPHRMRC